MVSAPFIAATNPHQAAIDLAAALPVYTITYRAPWIDKDESRWEAEQVPFLKLQAMLREAAEKGELDAVLAAVQPILEEKRIQVLTQPGYAGTLVSHWEARRGETSDLIKLPLRSVDQWRGTFERLNKGDLIAESDIVQGLVEGWATGLQHTNPKSVNILNIGAKASAAVRAIGALRETLGEDVAIHYRGTSHLKGQLAKAETAVAALNPPVASVSVKEGVFSLDITPDSLQQPADIVLCVHYYHGATNKTGFYDGIKAASHENTLLAVVYNDADDLATFKDGQQFGHLFRPDQGMAHKMLAAVNASRPDGSVYQGDYTFHLDMPALTDEDWDFIQDMPTAVYDRDWAAERGAAFGEAWDLLSFKFHVPLNALSKEERAEMVPALRSLLEQSGNQIAYHVKYVVGHLSMLDAAAAPELKRSVEQASAALRGLTPA